MSDLILLLRLSSPDLIPVSIEPYVCRETSPGAFLSFSQHLPVQHSGVRQICEEIAVGPAHVQDAMGVIH